MHCLLLSLQQGRSTAGNGPTGAGESPGSQPPSTIPQPLLLPQGVGGCPISLDTAMRLQKLLFRNMTPLFSCEWAAAHFRFRPPHSDLAYALEAGKGGTRAILVAVQAHIISYLLFTRETECTHLERLCRVGQWEQGQALAMALAEILWAAGGGGRAVVCLITAPITMMPHEGYRANSFTERIQLFEFSEKAAAQGFISDHIHCFKGEGSHGVILFLYSLLFSRTLERVQEDLGDTAPLLNISSGNITCTEAVLSLLLTGRASPRELGGSQELESGTGDGDGEALWQRGAVGFLRWERAPVERQVSAGAAPWTARPTAGPWAWHSPGSWQGSPCPGEPRAADASAARVAVQRLGQAQRALRHRQPAALRLEIRENFPPVLLQWAAGADPNSPPDDRHSFASLGRGSKRRPLQPTEGASSPGDGNQDQVGRCNCQLEWDRPLLLKSEKDGPLLLKGTGISHTLPTPLVTAVCRTKNSLPNQTAFGALKGHPVHKASHPLQKFHYHYSKTTSKSHL
ncbi:inactive ubiquitin carboxyl-terminal hydrolase MINDY-4B isoform 1-T1 [Cyanocitta cristata]